MADLALVTANKVSVVESIEQMTLPAAEAITAGQAVRLDTANGKFTKANATTTAEARVYGIATKTVPAGMAVTALRQGVLDGHDIAALAWDADIYLSDTDGALADTPGTVNIKVGRVVPGTPTTLGTAYDRLLAVDCSDASEQADNDAIRVHVKTELLAASVDKWIFIADRAYKVTLIQEVHSVVGGASAAVRPRKVLSASTAAPGAAAGANVKELTTANIDLTAAIDTVQTPTLTATAADLLLAAGDKIGLDFSGTLTGLVGQLTITLKPV